MFCYDALMQSLRDEGDSGSADFQKLETAREDYVARLHMFNLERTFEKRKFYLH
jgi:hypothetical protein